MKTIKFNLLLILSVFMVIVSCEQENFTESENLQPEEEFLKSVAGDTTISDIPDIVIDDPILQDQAVVSQYNENLLTYTYDRLGRLENISYFRKGVTAPSAEANQVQRFVYMRDKFVYGNSGQLIELRRHSLSEKPLITSLSLIKSYKYNSIGQLEQIITRMPDNSYKWDKFEFLYYDKSGHMIRKVVKLTNLPTWIFIYSYDKIDRLMKIACYTSESSRPRFICDLYYDNQNNIQRKEFYYPLDDAVSVNDVIRKWVVYYKYDVYNNPFKDFKLPVSSLFEWMDLISPANIAAISFDDGSLIRSVFYIYRYNNLGYPVLRYRISPLTANE